MTDTQMTDAYHKARRQLALFSGLLLVWEYIGVRLGDIPTGTVKAKLPVADATVTLQNPEVVPVVIAIVTIYFAYRLTVEWFQCDDDIRHSLVTRIDLYVAYFIASSALIVFAFQQATTFRLAELLTPQIAFGLITGFFTGLGVLVVIRLLRSMRSIGGFPRFLLTENMSYLAFLLLSVFALLFAWIQPTVKLVETVDELAFLFPTFEAPHPISLIIGWSLFALILWFYRNRAFQRIVRATE